MKRLFLLIIKGYQYFISPMLGNNCRYHPSCSHYAQEAIQVHGAVKGSAMAIWRILRCNPFSKGGFDPVPPKKGDADHNLIDSNTCKCCEKKDD